MPRAVRCTGGFVLLITITLPPSAGSSAAATRTLFTTRGPTMPWPLAFVSETDSKMLSSDAREGTYDLFASAYERKITKDTRMRRKKRNKHVDIK